MARPGSLGGGENRVTSGTRTALVTGGGRGLGAAICETLASSRVRVAPLARSASEVDEVASRCEGLGLVADVSDSVEVGRAVHRLLDAWGRLDIVVNNAGIGMPRADLDEVSVDDWRRLVDVNLTGAFSVLQAAAPALRRSAAGRVVNIASMAGLQPLPRMVAYATSKSALVGLTKAAARELAPDCTVNAVAPGYLDVGIGSTVLADEGYRRFVLERTPVARLGRAEEVADLVAFLASERAGFITGQTITIDGGWTLV